MGGAFMLVIEWHEPNLPRYVGPFGAHAAAVEWAHLNVSNGSWCVALLAAPGAEFTLAGWKKSKEGS